LVAPKNPKPKKPGRKPNALPGWEIPFFAALKEYGVIGYACDAASVNRSTVMDRVEKDPDFKSEFDASRESATDKLEREAFRRAHNGVEEAIYHKGLEIGRIRKYSDTLLIFLLKGNRPDKYRETFGNQLSGVGGGPIHIVIQEATPPDDTAA